MTEILELQMRICKWLTDRNLPYNEMSAIFNETHELETALWGYDVKPPSKRELMALDISMCRIAYDLCEKKRKITALHSLEYFDELCDLIKTIVVTTINQ